MRVIQTHVIMEANVFQLVIIAIPVYVLQTILEKIVSQSHLQEMCAHRIHVRTVESARIMVAISNAHVHLRSLVRRVIEEMPAHQIHVLMMVNALIR